MERGNLRTSEPLNAFLHSMSHDLRAPLRHIDGFCKLLAQDYGPTLPQQGRHYLERIARAAGQMGTMLDSLLDLLRAERQPLKPQSTDLNWLVAGQISEITARAGQRRIRWEVGSLPVVVCDRALVGDVFRNLMDNAVRSTAGKDEARIRIDSRKTRTGYRFTICDNGVGFQPRFAARLFEPFRRLHSRELFPGAGLGLALVRRIVERHGGRVWAEGAPERGACVHFTLGNSARPQK